MRSSIQVGIIGCGVFGRFMAEHLAERGEVLVYDRVKSDPPRGTKWGPLDEVLAQPVIILAVPVQKLEALLVEIGSRVRGDALVLDVSSVKAVPIALMSKYLPKSCQILGTHPLFGPVSSSNGIPGLTISVWPVRIDDISYIRIKNYLSVELELKVIEVNPYDHDKEMAYVQALTFFVGRALNDMEIPDSNLKTATYKHMLEIQRTVSSETLELFETIEAFNPHAKAVREQLVDRLNAIEKSI